MDRLVCSLSPFSEANFRRSVFPLKDKIEDKKYHNNILAQNNEMNGPSDREEK